MDTSQSLGNYLREARLRAGLSQSELARRLSFKSAQSISNLERNLSSLPKGQIHNFISILNLDPPTLLALLRQRWETQILKHF